MDIAHILAYIFMAYFSWVYWMQVFTMEFYLDLCDFLKGVGFVGD